MRRAITCIESNDLRRDLRPYSSLTNYIKRADGTGEVLNDDGRPRHTHTVWCDADERPVMEDYLDADGCRHYDLRDGVPS